MSTEISIGKRAYEEDMLIIKIMHQQNLTDLAISEHIGCSRGLVSRKIREMGLR